MVHTVMMTVDDTLLLSDVDKIIDGAMLLCKEYTPLSLSVSCDKLGRKVIGYERLVNTRRLPLKMTVAVAEEWLREDVIAMFNRLDKHLSNISTTTNQYIALLSYFTSCHHLTEEIIEPLDLHMSGRYEECADRIQESVFLTGRKFPDFIQRRYAESIIYRQGITDLQLLK